MRKSIKMLTIRLIGKCCLLLGGYLTVAVQPVRAQQTQIRYLSGTDKDHTVNWAFFCTKGYHSGSWTTIPVPSNWELQGFGGYNYGMDKHKNDEQGLYSYHFIAEKAWQSKQALLVFEGVMTDAEVKLNGQLVGPVHQGSFYRFQYNVTSLLKPGADNLLEVKVSKMSADTSVNRAERMGDFWVFGGIYRPVYLKIMPQTFVDRVAIDARADGQFNADVFAEGAAPGDVVSVQVKTLQGKNLGDVFSAQINNPKEKISLSNAYRQPALWNPEMPVLYNADISIMRAGTVLHTYHQRFGFRSVEVRAGDGIYVNNKKIVVKGVNRHSFWPESGRTLSRAIHLMDISLLKDMNMNAVRMSHYPPDAEFLDLCDSLGLFVLDEVTGWQKKYATPIGHKIVKEMVTRDVNHPSVIFWDNGNEGGFNTDLDGDYALYDPQKRAVLHPWAKFSEVQTKHYPDFSYVQKHNAENAEIFMPTEFIHGLFDGGNGAALDDFWHELMGNPHNAGGFLWAFLDEGVVRHDKKDSIDTDGNHAPDGIVGPHREKEGSFYTIKEIWSPVQPIAPVLDKTFTGKITLENHYIYTDLSACKFSWQLVKFPLANSGRSGHVVIATGKSMISLAPGKSGDISLSLPATWQEADELRFTATDHTGRELYTWTWPIKSAGDIAKQNISALKRLLIKPTAKQVGGVFTVSSNGISFNFDTLTGYLKTVARGRELIPFGNGPVLAGAKQRLKSFTHSHTKNGVAVEAEYDGDGYLKVSWNFQMGKPTKLDYHYTLPNPADFLGITFNTDETLIKGMRWLGGGPYRVWKNRLKGVTVDVWHKKYNNTITGATFDYPEFKGDHADLFWAVIETSKSKFTVYTDKPGVYLQMLKPQPQKLGYVAYVAPPFPEGNLGFMNAIPAIGTKFTAAEKMGPQSQKTIPKPVGYDGTLWFVF